jgi:hypothetical protein
LIFPEAVFFPRFDISPSTEIGGHVLSWFYGFLERTLMEFVNFKFVCGFDVGVGIWNREYLTGILFLFGIRRAQAN